MLPTYQLARDHLQRAATILQGTDSRSRQLRYIIERTVSLIDDLQPQPEVSTTDNVLDLAHYRDRSARRH